MCGDVCPRSIRFTVLNTQRYNVGIVCEGTKKDDTVAVLDEYNLNDDTFAVVGECNMNEANTVAVVGEGK